MPDGIIEVYIWKGEICVGIETEQDKDFERRFFENIHFFENSKYTKNMYFGSKVCICVNAGLNAGVNANLETLKEIKTFKSLQKAINHEAFLFILRMPPSDRYTIKFNKLIAGAGSIGAGSIGAGTNTANIISAISERFDGKYHIARIKHIMCPHVVALNAAEHFEEILKICENELLTETNAAWRICGRM